MNERQLREQVRRDAIAIGTPDDLAAFLAKHVGKSDGLGKYGMPRVTNVKATVARPPAADRLRAMCAMYGAEALVPEFRKSGACLTAVAQMLEAATGTAKAIPPGGVAYIRVRLAQTQPGARP